MAPSRVLAVGFTFAFLLAAAPPADAQLEVLVDPPVEVAVTVAASDQPIRPVLDIGTATATIDVTCTSPGIYTKPVEIIHNVQSDASFGAGFVAEFNATVEFAPEECLPEATTKSYTVLIDVQFSSVAPAFEEPKFTFIGTANTTEGRADWNEVVGFGGTLTARLTQGFSEENGTVPIVGEITNAANGAVDVTVTVESPPSSGRLEPTDLTLAVATGAGSAGKSPFRFEYVPTKKQLDAFTLRFVASAAKDPSQQLDPYTLDVTLDPENEAIYSSGSKDKGSPGPAAILLALSLLALLALLRRR